MFKKFIFSFLITSYAFLTLGASPAKAVLYTGPWYDQSPVQFYGQVYGDNDTEIFGERYTAAQVQWVVYSLIFVPINLVVNTIGHTLGFSTKDVANILGGDVLSLSPTTTLLASNATATQPSTVEGIKSTFSKIFADRPLSGITYTRQKLTGLKIVSEAHAQETGFGYQGLGAIQGFWVATRDMSYSLFVLITLALAFMIMFRVKLSPQTVVSIQSTLPKVFIALILVTFSYAIAGFLVDLMYVAIGLISLLLTSAGGNVSTTFDFLTKGIDPLGLGIGGGIFGTILYLLWIYFIVFLNAVGSADSAALGIIVLVLFIVFAILSIIIFFRLTLLLIRTFAEILLATIFAPLQITLGILFPDIGFGSWMKSYIAKLAVFPVVGLMIMLSYAFALSTLESIPGDIDIGKPDDIPALVTDLDFGSYTGEEGWPPYLNIGATFMAVIFIIISFEILHKTPEAANMIQGILSGKGPGSYGSAMTAATGLGLGIYAGRQSRHTAEAEFASRSAPGDEDLARAAARRKRYQQRVENWQRNLK